MAATTCLEAADANQWLRLEIAKREAQISANGALLSQQQEQLRTLEQTQQECLRTLAEQDAMLRTLTQSHANLGDETKELHQGQTTLLLRVQQIQQQGRSENFKKVETFITGFIIVGLISTGIVVTVLRYI